MRLTQEEVYALASRSDREIVDYIRIRQLRAAGRPPKLVNLEMVLQLRASGCSARQLAGRLHTDQIQRGKDPANNSK